jgi:single-strand DNA-binding protein
MANLNKVMLIGRLTRDPETRNVSSGNAVVSFGLATNRTYMNKSSGEKVEETTFVDIEAWGRTGETIARYMQKGRQIYVEGRLKFDTWEKDGQRRSKLSVVCDTFQFIDSQGGGGGAAGGGGGRSEGQSQSQQGKAAPVAAAQTPQDDYGDDDIPF